MRILAAMVSLAAVAVSTSAMAATALTSTVSATPGASTGVALSATALGNLGTASASGNTGVALVPLSQFNSNSGILLGARVTATVPVSLTTVVTGTVPARGSGRAISATSTYTAAVTAPGVNITGSQISATATCSGGNCPNSPTNQSRTVTGSVSGNAAVSAGSLAAYYGTGTVGLATEGALNVAVTNDSNVTSGRVDGTVSRTAGATYSIAYDYLNFSSPSFASNVVQDALNLDFGTLGLGSASTTLNFTLFNIGNANSAGFDLLSVSRDTGNALFSTTLLPFTNSVEGGGSRTFQMSFNPATLGSQFDVFRLRLRDSAADVDSGVGARDYDLRINVASFVVLPEPGSWATMIIGFGLIGGTMRRRRVAAT
jgi:hypothetical protein